MNTNIEPTTNTTPASPIKRRNGKVITAKEAVEAVLSNEKVHQELIVATPQQQSISLYDMQPQEFTTALARREENWKSLLLWIKSNLVEGEDFYKLKFNGKETKPSLSKAGAEKICSLLGITSHFSNSEKWEQMLIDGKKIEQVIIRCELKSNGRTIAEGMGARSISQDKGDLNKCLKMAEKSAFIDATIRCAAVNSVFTQDIEDMQQREPTRIHAVPTPTPRPIKKQEPSDLITTGQLNQLKQHIAYSVIRYGQGERAVSLDEFTERLEKWCNKKWGLESWGALLREQWDVLMTYIPSMVIAMQKELNPPKTEPELTPAEEEERKQRQERAQAEATSDAINAHQRD